MIRKIALIGAATLFSVSLAVAQSNSSPDSTAGGAMGTAKSKQGMQQQKGAPKGTTGAGNRGGESSPDSTAGGAAGTSKGNNRKN